MGIAFRIDTESAEESSTAAEADYSRYTLQQLLKARHWFDADRHPSLVRWIEEEIQKRCVPIRREDSSAAGSSRRYRPYGLMFGVFFLAVSSGPFIGVEFLDMINVVTDVNGDNAFLSGVWALLTLPFAVMVYMIGGIMDAERVVKWFNL